MIAQSLAKPIYFCDSRSPWRRGSEKNTNGMLRDYFPKGTDLSSHSPERLLAVEDELNNRPRRILDDQLSRRVLQSPTSPRNHSVVRG
jgi:transposase, IS30 family